MGRLPFQWLRWLCKTGITTKRDTKPTSQHPLKRQLSIELLLRPRVATLCFQVRPHAAFKTISGFLFPCMHNHGATKSRNEIIDLSAFVPLTTISAKYALFRSSLILCGCVCHDAQDEIHKQGKPECSDLQHCCAPQLRREVSCRDS